MSQATGLVKNGKTFISTNIQHKGGVGKTTLTINCAARLGEMGYKVLVVDLDSQLNSTRHLAVVEDYKNLPNNISNLLYNFKTLDPRTTIISGQDVRFENVSLIPGSKSITEAELNLQRSSPIPNEVLNKILKQLHGEFDFILIDCPPRVETLTYNALVAANTLMVPFYGEYSVDGFDNILDIMDSLETTNPKLKILAPVLNKYNKTTLADKEVKSTVEELFSNEHLKGKVVSNELIVVPNSTVFEQSVILKTSIFDKAISKKPVEQAIQTIVDLLIQEYEALV